MMWPISTAPKTRESITQQEQLARRDDPVRRGVGRRFGRLWPAAVPEDVRLVERDVVHVHLAIQQRDVVAREPDDALDERHAIRFGQLLRRIEDDDVAPGIRRPAGCELVDQHVLVRQERVLHRLLLDLERLGDEGLDPEEDEDRQDEGLDELEEAAQRPWPVF